MLGFFFRHSSWNQETARISVHLELYLWLCVAREVGKYHPNVLRRADNWRENKRTFPKKICTTFPLPPIFLFYFLFFLGEKEIEDISVLLKVWAPSFSWLKYPRAAGAEAGSRTLTPSEPMARPRPLQGPDSDHLSHLPTTFLLLSAAAGVLGVVSGAAGFWSCSGFLEQPSRYQGCAWSLSVWHKAMCPPSPAPFPAPSDNSSRQWFPPPALLGSQSLFTAAALPGMCCVQGRPSQCLFNLWLLPGNIRQGSASMNSEVTLSQTLTPRSKRRNYLSNAKNQCQSSISMLCRAGLLRWQLFRTVWVLMKIWIFCSCGNGKMDWAELFIIIISLRAETETTLSKESLFQKMLQIFQLCGEWKSLSQRNGNLWEVIV